jgi:hypothetical protein
MWTESNGQSFDQSKRETNPPTNPSHYCFTFALAQHTVKPFRILKGVIKNLHLLAV